MIYAEFGYGKHDGKVPDQVPVDYLRWVLGNIDDLDPDLETAIRASLRKRGGGGHSRQSGSQQSSRSYAAPPSAALPVAVSAALAAEIIQAGRRALALRYHPDMSGGEAEKMVRINATSDFLEKRLNIILGGAA